MLQRDPVFLVGVLAGLVALAELLARRTPLRHLGAALLVIVLGSVATNAGLVPAYSGEVGVYAAVFTDVAPLGIFFLLLQVSLASLRRAGGPMLAAFLIGSAGTVAGALAAFWAVGGRDAFGPLAHALAGMFTGTYTGGSVNFNAVALRYRVELQPALFAGAAVVDSAMTTFWMAACVALPRLFARRWPAGRGARAAAVGAPDLGVESDTEALHPLDVTLLLALGAAALLAADALDGWLADAYGIASTRVLWVTVLALALAQVPACARLRGTRVLGMTALMVFLAVIGTLCDLAALRQLGALGLDLSLFVVVLVAVHAGVLFGAAWLLRLDLAVAAVASQANIGGGTSALALARGLGRGDLALPAVLVGSLGTALGTFLGFAVAGVLG